MVGKVLNMFLDLYVERTIFSDKCSTYNINDNPKINILMSENIRYRRVKILEYFDAYICHYYQPFRLIMEGC